MIFKGKEGLSNTGAQPMTKYLVIGMESTCTKYVAFLLAYNLGIVSYKNEWDATEFIENEQVSVTHRSLPHGDRSNFLSLQDCEDYDFIVMTTRDFYCSLQSKIRVHQPEIEMAGKEHLHARSLLQEFYQNLNVTVWSYESAFILGEAYTKRFLNNLGFEHPKVIELNDINFKYINM